MKLSFAFFLFILTLFLLTENILAQSALITDYSEVVEKAKAELDSLMAPGSELQKKAASLAISGEFTADVSVYEKGKVLSVFMVSSGTEDIKIRNKAKDLIKSIEFSFKLPKGKNYKFQYQFKFN